MPYQASSYQNSPRPVGQASLGGHIQHQPGSRRAVKGGAAGGGVAHRATPFTGRSESGLPGEQRLLVLPGIGGGVGGHPPRLEPSRDSATRPEYTPVAVDPDAALPGRDARSWASEAGLNVYDLEKAAKTALRLKMRNVLRNVRTKRSKRPAWDAVSYCGRVIPQAGISASGALAGGRLVRASCGLHKLCPRCAAEKSRHDAFQLRCHVDAVEGETIVATLTQLKRARRRESCSEALDRFTESLRRLNSGTMPKKEPDRDAKPERWAAYWWKKIIRGAHRSIEVTYSGKHQGARFSGFHVHAHLVAELHDPPLDWMEAHYGKRCPDLSSCPEAWDMVREEWRLYSMERLVECWRAVSPVHESKAVPKAVYGDTGFTWNHVHVDQADARRVYQACKYATKPSVLSASEMEDEKSGDHADSAFWATVEMLTAVQERKLQSAWGTWRNWQKDLLDSSPVEEKKALESVEVITPDPEPDDEAPAVERWVPLRADLQRLVVAANSGGDVESIPRRGGPPLEFDALDLLAHIRERIKCSPDHVAPGEVTTRGIAA